MQVFYKYTLQTYCRVNGRLLHYIQGKTRPIYQQRTICIALYIIYTLYIVQCSSSILYITYNLLYAYYALHTIYCMHIIHYIQSTVCILYITYNLLYAYYTLHTIYCMHYYCTVYAVHTCKFYVS